MSGRHGARVVVVGGGITGLSCAQRLAGLGVDVLVLEGSRRVGGRIETVNDGGVQFEAGPNTLLVNTPAMVELIEEVGLGERVVRASEGAKRRYIAKGARLCALPRGPVGALLSPLVGPLGLLGAAGDLWRRGRGGEDESVAAFVTRRFGRRVLENLVEPFLTGVHAGDVRRLEARSVLPMLVEAEERSGSVAVGLVKARREKRRRDEETQRRRGGALIAQRGDRWHGAVAFREGMEVLPRRIAGVLGERVRVGVRAERVRVVGDGCEVELAGGERVACGRVVIATEPAAAAGLIEGLPGAAPIVAGLRRIEFAGMGVLGVLYPRKEIAHPLDGFGFLGGPGWKGRVLGCVFRSAIFPHAAPPGMVLLTAFVGGAQDPGWKDLSDAELVRTAHGELAGVLGIRGEPRRVFVRRWEGAIPQLNVGHHRVARAVRAWMGEGPVRIVGNYLGGLSLGACVAAGRAEAERIAGELGGAGARREACLSA